MAERAGPPAGSGALLSDSSAQDVAGGGEPGHRPLPVREGITRRCPGHSPGLESGPGQPWVRGIRGIGQHRVQPPHRVLLILAVRADPPAGQAGQGMVPGDGGGPAAGQGEAAGIVQVQVTDRESSPGQSLSAPVLVPEAEITDELQGLPGGLGLGQLADRDEQAIGQTRIPAGGRAQRGQQVSLVIPDGRRAVITRADGRRSGAVAEHRVPARYLLGVARVSALPGELAYQGEEAVPCRAVYARAGGRFLVCPICFQAKAPDQSGLLANAELGGTVQLWEWIGAEPVTTFSY